MRTLAPTTRPSDRAPSSDTPANTAIDRRHRQQVRIAESNERGHLQAGRDAVRETPHHLLAPRAVTDGLARVRCTPDDTATRADDRRGPQDTHARAAGFRVMSTSCYHAPTTHARRGRVQRGTTPRSAVHQRALTQEQTPLLAAPSCGSSPTTPFFLLDWYYST